MQTVLTDKFDLTMFGKYPIKVIIDKLDKSEKEDICFELEFRQEENELINTITNTDLLVEISDFCGFVLNEGKNTEIKLKGNETVYVVNKENGKIVFYELLTDDCLLD
jgi:uncharacterized ubiquitin-like protein YukD